MIGRPRSGKSASNRGWGSRSTLIESKVFFDHRNPNGKYGALLNADRTWDRLNRSVYRTSHVNLQIFPIFFACSFFSPFSGTGSLSQNTGAAASVEARPTCFFKAPVHHWLNFKTNQSISVTVYPLIMKLWQRPSVFGGFFFVLKISIIFRPVKYQRAIVVAPGNENQPQDGAKKKLPFVSL